MAHDPKKIYLNKPAVRRDNVVVVPAVDNLVSDAMNIIEQELLKFRHKVQKGESLELPEGRLLTHYIKALIDLSKEARERDKAPGADLSKLTDEELAALALEMLNKKKTQP